MDAADGAPAWRPRLPRPTTADAIAGGTVALVAIPQALAYATVAGVPPVVGLAALAVATIAAAPFVSSPYLQTGPVAITALLAFGGLAGLAEPRTAPYVEAAALLALLVGVVRVVVGTRRLGVLAYLMSEPVLAGFTPAAALVIVVSQLPAVVGVTADARSPWQVVAALVDVGAWSWEELAVAGVTAAALLLGARVHALFPGVLVAGLVGWGLAAVAGFEVAVLGDVPSGLPQLSLALPLDQLGQLVVPALVIALVGFAEPAAIARRYAEESRTRWDADREFVSQGVANIASGVFGGFPVGGSFSRSAVARQAGARTAWTGAVTGVLVLAVSPFVGVLSRLPQAVLAAIIATSVVGLARPTALLAMRRLSRQQFVIASSTYALTLVTAPSVQWAVLAGIGMSIVAHLRRELTVAIPWSVEDRVLHLRPLGVLFFGSAHRLRDQAVELLAESPEVDRIEIHMDRLGRVDVTGAMALRTLVDELADAGVPVAVRNLTPTSRRIVDRVFSQDGRDFVPHAATTDRRPLRPGHWDD